MFDRHLYLSEMSFYSSAIPIQMEIKTKFSCFALKSCENIFMKQKRKMDFGNGYLVSIVSSKESNLMSKKSAKKKTNYNYEMARVKLVAN